MPCIMCVWNNKNRDEGKLCERKDERHRSKGLTFIPPVLDFVSKKKKKKENNLKKWLSLEFNEGVEEDTSLF